MGEGGCFDRIHRVAEAFPLVKAAAQRTDAIDAEFVQGESGFRCSRFAGAGAVEDDVSIKRDLVAAAGKGVRREMMRSGKSEWIRHEFQGMAQVDDIDRFAGVEHLFERLGLQARRSAAF